MLPWGERPSIDIDLAGPPQSRYRAVPPEILANGKEPVCTVLHEVPIPNHYQVLFDGPVCEPAADDQASSTHPARSRRFAVVSGSAFAYNANSRRGRYNAFKLAHAVSAIRFALWFFSANGYVASPEHVFSRPDRRRRYSIVCSS